MIVSGRKPLGVLMELVQAVDDQVVGRLDKVQPALAGGSLRSKPTWWNTSGCSTTSAFFVCAFNGHR